jgi:kumamolisin
MVAKWARGLEEGIVRSSLQKFGSTIVVLIVIALMFGALSNFGGLTSSQASAKRKDKTADLAKDLFADPPLHGVISKPLPDSAATSGREPINDLPLPRDSRKGWVRLPGEVPSALARATRPPEKMPADVPLTLTIILKHTDQAGFDRYYKEVYDPRSPSFRHFLSPREITARFGPTQKAYESVLAHLKRNGFTLVEGSANRLTLTVRGTRQQVERAFKVEIRNFAADGRRFFSNDRDPALPQSLAKNVLAVMGLSNLAVPRPANNGWGVLAYLYDSVVVEMAGANTLLATASETGSAAELAVAMLRLNAGIVALDAEAALAAASVAFRNGTLGRVPTVVQKIGIPAFSSFRQSDVADNLALFGKSGSLINQVNRVPVNGGAPLGSDQSDILLSINMLLTLAPTAQITVYDAPLANPGTSFQALFNAMINDGVSVISNSFGYCEDQTTAADVQSIDEILKTAAASGITVFNATGDFGSACRDGSANTVAVPADSPNATAVGGTSVSFAPGFNYGSESWWNGSADLPPSGQSGFGLSRFFARPSYQDALISTPTRSVPDVVAPALPAIPLCEADAGGCNTRTVYGGTSLATPIWAGLAAILNNNQGGRVGFLNPRIYPLAGTNAFHSASSIGSDAAHVGLGSPNGNLLDLALRGRTPGPVSPTVSVVTVSFSNPFTPFLGYVFADDSHSVSIVVNLYDADGNMVPGKTVTLSASGGSHAVITPASGVSSAASGAVVFTVKDTTAENVTFTATADGVNLAQTRTVRFVGPPASAGGISASPTTVIANGSDTTTITVTLQDAKGNPSPNKLISLSQGNGGSIVSGASATTDATGKVNFTASSNVNQTVTYTAVDVTDGNLPVPGSATVNFVNASGFCADFNNYKFGTAAPGYAVTTFASSFPIDCFSGLGPIGLVFTPVNNLLVGDTFNSTLYSFMTQGGVAGPATRVGIVTPASGQLAGLTFGRDGRLYAAQGPKVVEVDPKTGAVLRTVVTLAGDGKGMAVDPLSGDLFVSISFDGIKRISNYTTGPATLVPYTNGDIDGFAFAADGTIYAASGGGPIARITGTNTPMPGTLTVLTSLNRPDGIGIEPNPTDASKPFLYVNRNDGIITRIDTSALITIPASPCGSACTDIYTGGSRGDFVTVSNDGCLYATQSDRVIRITKADGTCGLTPVNQAPQLVLTPLTVSPAPAQGANVTFTATLRNVSTPANTPITLTVIGPNLQTILVRADANGQATFTYTGTFTGEDTLIATATIGTQAVVSNTSRVTWLEGKHTTFLSLNQSPGSGAPGKPSTLIGTLFDVSATPNPVPVVGASVTFTLTGQTCTGTTDSSGAATCSVTPNVPAGQYQINAAFSGTNQLLPSSANKAADLIEKPAIVTPSIQFSESAYSINEGCSGATITVTRTGDASGTATVDYVTSDSSAQQRTDYSIASGTLTFAPGETSKTFTVLVSKDAYAEGNETLTVTLGNWTGAALGTPNTATVTIIDDTSVPTNSQPIDDAATFVCQHYHDFLSREADPGGANYWTGQITQCGNNATCIRNQRVAVSNSFFYSDEFQQTGSYAYRLYRAAYGNTQPLPNSDANNTNLSDALRAEARKLPSYAVFAFDRARVIGGADLATGQQNLANAFVRRAEFLTKYPASQDGPTFVDAVLATIKNDLGVDLTSQRPALITVFNSGGRGAVMYRLANDDAQGSNGGINNRPLIDEEYNRAFVATEYFGYLRRDSDIGGYLFWLGQVNRYALRNGDAQHAMVCSFITSDEYQQRFSTVVTHHNSECPQ